MKRGYESEFMHRDHKRRATEYEATVPNERKRAYRSLMRTSWQDPCFMGVLSKDQVRQQETLMLSGNVRKQHFYYMACSTPGLIAAAVSYIGPSGDFFSARLVAYSLDEIAKDVQSYRRNLHPTSQPLSRADSIFFQSTARAFARDAILMWCMCAKRLGVVKDVAQYIAHIVWQDFKCWIP